ncbi:hypothetical protein [Pedobacter metabolipauper]|uniref:Uncharacterized protein n=1 Tax=Pedobacter metabolipauper TaxID=425513 RepID=A0A4R6SRE0_9SPHI|nr:hypothetical protein [Pedobacter metabolipauper]TDQ06672.1 hypothetical protein ATK78_4331 [Pedobacter metabolipauper]
MKKYILFISVLAFYYLPAQCQGIKKKDILEVHQLVIDFHKKYKLGIVLRSTTNKNILKEFEFNDLNTISGNFKKKLEENDLIDFLNEIDTSKIRDYKLESKGELVLDTTKYPLTEHKLTFSPAIISNDSKKAMVLAKIYIVTTYGSTSGSIMAWFFEKIDHKWVMKIVETLMYLD